MYDITYHYFILTNIKRYIKIQTILLIESKNQKIKRDKKYKKLEQELKEE